MKKIAVIGGGAAGYFAAITCADKNPEVQVELFESTSKPLKKVRISGGGRCNVTHSCFEPPHLVKNYPRGSREMLGNFFRFQPRNTVEWFESRGVKLKTEADGRMFPMTDSSETIAMCLEDEAKKAGVKVRLETGVPAIKKDGKGFELSVQKGSDFTTEKFDAVLIATGSNPIGYRLAESLGHSIVQPVPSLFTFNIEDPKLADLAGVAFTRAHLKLTFPDKGKLHQIGPTLITHWGLSGPAVLKLSAFGARPLHHNDYKATLHISILPEETQDTIYEKLCLFKEDNLKGQISNHRPFTEIPKRFWQRICDLNGLPESMIWAEVPAKSLRRLSEEITQGEYQVNGKGVFKEEFVTCGGIQLREVNFKTMESKFTPGLFFAGEVLDIDGITGGFNFQNAWTTGFISGTSLRGKN